MASQEIFDCHPFLARELKLGDVDIAITGGNS